MLGHRGHGLFQFMYTALFNLNDTAQLRDLLVHCLCLIGLVGSSLGQVLNGLVGVADAV